MHLELIALKDTKGAILRPCTRHYWLKLEINVTKNVSLAFILPVSVPVGSLKKVTSFNYQKLSVVLRAPTTCGQATTKLAMQIDARGLET